MSALLSGLLAVSLAMSAVIAALLLLTPALGRRYPARWRCWAWLLVTARLLIPLNLPLPRAPVEIPAPPAHTLRAPAPMPAPAADVAAPLPKAPEITGAPTADSGAGGYGEAAAAQAGPAPLPARLDPAGLAALLWAAGAAAVLLLRFGGYACFLRDVSRWSAGVPEGLRADWEAACAAQGLAPAPVFLYERAGSPMLTGFLRPMLLLPRTDLDARERKLIFRHELEHRKRRDLWYKLALTLACALHWFNPLVWLMARAAGHELELACDDEVVRGLTLGERCSYGRVLLGTARGGRAPVFSTHFRGGRETVRRRLQNILDLRAKRRGLAALCAVALAAAVTAGCVSVGGAQNAAPDPNPAGQAAGKPYYATAKDALDALTDALQTGDFDTLKAMGSPGQPWEDELLSRLEGVKLRVRPLHQADGDAPPAVCELSVKLDGEGWESGVYSASVTLKQVDGSWTAGPLYRDGSPDWLTLEEGAGAGLSDVPFPDEILKVTMAEPGQEPRIGYGYAAADAACDGLRQLRPVGSAPAGDPRFEGLAEDAATRVELERPDGSALSYLFFPGESETVLMTRGAPGRADGTNHLVDPAWAASYLGDLSEQLERARDSRPAGLSALVYEQARTSPDLWVNGGGVSHPAYAYRKDADAAARAALEKLRLDPPPEESAIDRAYFTNRDVQRLQIGEYRLAAQGEASGLVYEYGSGAVWSCRDLAPFHQAVRLILEDDADYRRAANTLETGLADPLAVGEALFLQRMRAATAEDIVPLRRLTDVTLRPGSGKLIAGDLDEFACSFEYGFTAPEGSAWISANGDNPAPGVWTNCYSELRVKRTGDRRFEIVGLGTGGYGSGLISQDTIEEFAPVLAAMQKGMDAARGASFGDGRGFVLSDGTGTLHLDLADGYLNDLQQGNGGDLTYLCYEDGQPVARRILSLDGTIVQEFRLENGAVAARRLVSGLPPRETDTGYLFPSGDGSFLIPKNPLPLPEGARLTVDYKGYAGHTGADFAVKTGTPIPAASDGAVSFAGWKSAYGNCVILDHAGRLQTVYAHCDALQVKAGDEVKRGGVIATAGKTGNATGSMLHFECWTDGDPANPWSYFVKP